MPTYPCPSCGGNGWTGRTLTTPCRPCRTTGEVEDRPAPRPSLPRPRTSGWTAPMDDPWFNPAAAGPPPF